MLTSTAARVLVTVDDQHLPEIGSIAAALRSSGVKVTNVMDTLGIISAEVTPEQKRLVENVTGVSNVELDEEMQAF